MGSRTPPRRKKGTPKTGGRKKGTPNRATAEVRALSTRIVDDPVYQANLLKRAQRGKLHPVVERELWHFAWGKPKDTVEHTGPGGAPVGIVVEFVRPRDGGGG